jgi:hypothetical protein
MSIDRGPILSIAAPYEVRQRLRDAAQSRIARDAPSTSAEYLERHRETAARASSIAGAARSAAGSRRGRGDEYGSSHLSNGSGPSCVDTTGRHGPTASH